MSLKDKTVFGLEIQDSTIFYGCEDGSEGKDNYQRCILPFNVGDNITKGNKDYKITKKDWDYDTNTVYFVAR